MSIYICQFASCDVHADKRIRIQTSICVLIVMRVPDMKSALLVHYAYFRFY